MLHGLRVSGLAALPAVFESWPPGGCALLSLLDGALDDYSVMSNRPRDLTTNTHVLRTSHNDGQVPESTRHLAIAIRDDANASLLTFVTVVLTWMNKTLNEGKSIYIHCLSGMSRSPSFAAAYLIAKGSAKTVDDALRKVKDVHMEAAPSDSFTRQLHAYALALSTFPKTLKGSPHFEIFAFPQLAHDVPPPSTDARTFLLLEVLAYQASVIEEFDGCWDDIEQTLMGTSTTRGVAIARCKACRYVLANEGAVIGSRTDCTSSTRIVGVQWMGKPYVEAQSPLLHRGPGRLRCPGCRARVGTYQWRYAVTETCRWITRDPVPSGYHRHMPLFQLNHAAVDWLR